MDLEHRRLDIERKLARCRRLADELVGEPTAQHLREMENDLRDQLRALDPKSDTASPKQR